ncbi:hypothetical protein OG21DRAFT_1509023 [Imleria badia]|nr:hypothetical protein OG21DRAFT_1509023 [Imleria badia]
MEVEVLKDGGAIGEEGEADAKSSLAYIQLEKHNERLKEALSPRRVTTNRTGTIPARCRDGEGHHEHR